MNKIPLEATLAGAYRFLFSNIVSIIGTLWFPVVLLAGLIGGLVWLVVPHAWLMGTLPAISKDHVDKDAVMVVMELCAIGIPLLLVGGLLVRAMVAVGILRHSTGEKTSPTLIYFSLGARVWRMVAVILLAVVVYVGLYIAAVALMTIVNIVVAAIPHVPPIATGVVNFALGLVVVITFAYVMLRLFFFLPAVVVAENKVGLGRAWALGQGNVWRILVILLAVIVPVQFLAGIVFYMTVIPTVVFAAIRQHPEGPEQALAFLKSLWPLLPLFGGIIFVAAIAITGLMLGAIGTAYKAVTAQAEEISA
jgi:hypothetical protein